MEAARIGLACEWDGQVRRCQTLHMAGWSTQVQDTRVWLTSAQDLWLDELIRKAEQPNTANGVLFLDTTHWERAPQICAWSGGEQA